MGRECVRCGIRNGKGREAGGTKMIRNEREQSVDLGRRSVAVEPTAGPVSFAKVSEYEVKQSLSDTKVERL